MRSYNARLFNGAILHFIRRVKEKVMLRYLRENTGNWIIKIFLGIIVIVFVFLGVGSLGSKKKNSVASINDEHISIQEYQQAYKKMVEQMRIRFGKALNDDILKALNIKQQAVESLIQERLILNEADKLEVTVSKNELQQNLVTMKAFQVDGKFNLEQYKKVLSLNSLTPETFEQDQIRSLKQQKVRGMVLDAVVVSDLEAQNFYQFQSTQMAVDYLFFNPTEYSDITPDEEQIKKFYDENKAIYKSEPQLKAVYLKFSPEDHKDKVIVSHENIKDYYEQNLASYKVPEMVEARHILIRVSEDAGEEKIADAKKRATDIYAMVSDGKDFEVLAKQYSEGPTKDTGGYLGTFDRQSMVKPFADKAFAMKAGEVSEPVKTRFGWHIIELVAKLDATTQTLEQVSETIKEQLAGQEMLNLAYYKAGEAFDSVVDGDDFEQVALIVGKKVVETKAFQLDGAGLEIADNAGFARAAFELSIGNISDVKQFGESYYLLKVVDRIEPVQQTIDIVKEKIVTELTATLQREKAKEEASLYLAKAKVTKSLENIIPETKISDNKVEVKSTKLFKRNGSIEGVGNSSKIIQASFTLNKTDKIYSTLVETPFGYYILGFKEKKMPAESEITENLKTVKEEIKFKKQSQAFQEWLVELKKHNKITYNTQILN
jgi:peptidyl-prolyl cis-trans isomerase D